MTRQKRSIFDRSAEAVWELGERGILDPIDHLPDDRELEQLSRLAPEQRQLLDLLRYRMFTLWYSAAPSVMVVSKLSSHATRPLIESGRVLLVEAEELAVEWLNQSSAPPGSLRPERALETIKKVKGKR